MRIRPTRADYNDCKRIAEAYVRTQLTFIHGYVPEHRIRQAVRKVAVALAELRTMQRRRGR